METIIFTFVCLLLGLLVVMLSSSVKIVPEYQRLVAFRLGRPAGVRGPGLVLLIPVIDRAVRVDLRPQERKLGGIQTTTRDNERVNVDCRWVYNVIDAEKSVLAVGNYEARMEEAAKSVFQEMYLGDLLTDKGKVEARINDHLLEIARTCGIRVAEFQVLEIKRVSVE